MFKKKVGALEKIEYALREKWLAKNITIEELPIEMQKLVEAQKKDTTNFEKWREYLRAKCVVDEKVKNAEMNIVTIIPMIFSAVALLSVSESLLLIFQMLHILMVIASLVIIGSAIKPYIGTYPRKRAFYELLLYYVDKV